jgi:DNA polymerase I
MASDLNRIRALLLGEAEATRRFGGPAAPSGNGGAPTAPPVQDVPGPPETATTEPDAQAPAPVQGVQGPPETSNPAEAVEAQLTLVESEATDLVAAVKAKRTASRKAPAGPPMPKRLQFEGFNRPLPEDAVYVGRPSPWGNPYRVEDHGRAEAVALYKADILSDEPFLERARAELAGKDLACWCGPRQKCHADVLLEVANPGAKRASSKATATPKPVTPNPFHKYPEPPPVPFELLSTSEDVQALVDRWLANPPARIGLDLETTGLSPLLGAHIRTVQLLAEGEATCWVVDTWAVGNTSFQQLAPLFELPATELVAHNAAFEVEHLAAAGIRIRAPIRCTMQAASLLSLGVLPTRFRTESKGSGLSLASCAGRIGWNVSKEQQSSDWGAEVLSQEQLAYAALDSWLALELWKRQGVKLDLAGMLRVHQLEGQALSAVAEARLTGLVLDLPRTRELLALSQEQLEQVAVRLQDLGVENANSTRQVAAAVEARGHQLPTTEAGNKSVSEDVLRPLYAEDAGLDPIAEHRKLQKNVRTYLRSWVALAEADPESRIRPQLRSLGASTGRMSCPKGELPKPTNLHGVPVESDLRSLFSAAPGHVLVDGDWGAIEHRLAAAMYGEAAYVAIYTSAEPDPHSHTASAIFGRPITKADAAERATGKTANFCLQYGGGPRRLQPYLEAALGRPVPFEEAVAVCRGWERAYPALAALRNRYRAREPWKVRSANGRVMCSKRMTSGVPGERFSDAEAAPMKSTVALAAPIQSSGAELLKDCLALLMPRLWDAFGGAVRVAHIVHDEIILEAPEALAEEAAALLLATMQDPGLEARYLRGVLPLVADVKVGRTWADVH